MIVGFVGLGNMGQALAANVVGRGFEVVAHDAFASERTPPGAVHVDDISEVARQADIVVLSLPDGAVCEDVATALATETDRRATHVVDTSTIGVQAAERIDALLRGAGVAYIDAPVSGGPAGARARTLSVMYAGSDDACVGVEPVLDAISDRRRRVGDRPGMGQAMKLANNFLSATALAATSEAVAFGRSVGLDLATMLEVLNASSGQNTATSDKFPNHVLTGTYASGFANTLMAKDLRLYAEAAGPAAVAAVVGEIWQRFAETEPGVDFTRIHPYLTNLHQERAR